MAERRGRSPTRTRSKSPGRTASKSPSRKKTPRVSSTPTDSLAINGDRTEKLQTATSQWFQRELKHIREDICTQVSMQLQCLDEEFTPLIAEQTKDEGGRVGEPGVDRPGKVFQPRESRLTEMLKISEFRTIYNIFVAVLIIFSLQTMVNDVVESGRIIKAFDFSLLTFAFGQLSVYVSTWVVMFLQTVAVFPIFYSWASSPAASLSRYMFLCILHLLTMCVWPFYVVFTFQLPPASTLIVVCEQIRLTMKAYSFVRECVPVVIERHKLKGFSEADLKANGIDFGHYLYFLFVPTLLFRSKYPRTPKVRWDVVLVNLLQVVSSLFFMHYIFLRFCVPQFSHFGKPEAQTDVKVFLNSVFQSMLPGTLVLLLGFFSVLHSWMNTWAELLQFADREFYKDWWNSKNFAMYYRTWNVIVHDWLYTYIYMDLRNLRLPFWSQKTVAMLTVFFISSVIHEYVITAALGFFYPILLVMFGGVGVFFIYLTRNQVSQIWNIFMWLMLFFGTGLLMVLYSVEWYARKNMGGDVEVAWVYWPPYTFRQPWSWGGSLSQEH